MEIGAANNITNFASSLARSNTTNADAEGEVNAFGIGSANQPDVELSPQARILQQNEANQSERASALGQDGPTEQQEEPSQTSGRDFVRVSSSVGSASRNNLSSERATEVYQSIQDLL